MTGRVPMSKFIRKSKLQKDSEIDFDTREYIGFDDVEQAEYDEEIASLEREIAKLNSKKEARKKMLMKRTGGNKIHYNEEYYTEALKPKKYSESSIKSMRNISQENPEIIRQSSINRDEYATDNGENYRSYFQTGTEIGSIFASNPGLLEEIMEEKAEKMKKEIFASKNLELKEAARKAEKIDRENNIVKKLGKNITASSLHPGNINNSVSYEKEVDNTFGQLNIENIEKIEEARKKMMTANCNRTKAIKSKHIFTKDNSWQDKENQKQRKLQDIYDNSTIIEHLKGYDNEKE